MNTFKKNGGFTLVELIIVIAILAILSTGAIAGYSKYIENANNTAVKAALSDIYTATVLANADTGNVKVTVGEKTENTKKVLEVKVEGAGAKFEDNIEVSLKIAGSYDATTKTYVGTMDLPSSWTSSKVYNGKTGLVLPVTE